MSDLIDKQVVLDTIHLFFTEEINKIPTKKTEDGEVYVIHKCQPLFEMNKAICKRIKALPSVTAEPQDKDIIWYDKRNYSEIVVKPQKSDHKCHTCKHYTSGERDGSCGSYICKGYSNWESEG